MPQRLAKWSTSSSPRPRSATSVISSESLRHADHQLVHRAGGEVGDRHGQPGLVGHDLDVQFGAGVFDRVGGELGGEQQRLVEQLVQVRLGEDGADEGAGGGGRAPVGGESDPPDVLVRASSVMPGPASADTSVSSTAVGPAAKPPPAVRVAGSRRPEGGSVGRPVGRGGCSPALASTAARAEWWDVGVSARAGGPELSEE